MIDVNEGIIQKYITFTTGPIGDRKDILPENP